MKNTIIYILLALAILLLISSVIFGILFYKERNVFDRFKMVASNEINQLKAVNENLKGSFFESQLYNNEKITISGSEDWSNFTFCLFISENQCSACVNAMLEYYTSNINVVSDSNFIILANFNNNSIKLLRAKHQLKCKIISTIDTNIKIAENKYPCFFILNKKKYESEMFFFPLKNEPEMMKKYFENINKKYFNRNNK